MYIYMIFQKMKIFRIPVIIIVVCMFSCENQVVQNDLNTYDTIVIPATDSLIKKDETVRFIPRMPSWLLERWVCRKEKESTLEIWEKVNDSTYSGTNYLTVSAGTVVQEELKLELRKSDLLYIATPMLMNPEKVSTTFVLTDFTDNKLIFKNPMHDFPQVITYTRISKDSIIAVVSGESEGRPDSVVFQMAREATVK